MGFIHVRPPQNLPWWAAVYHTCASQHPGDNRSTRGNFSSCSLGDTEMADWQANAERANISFDFLGSDLGTETVKGGFKRVFGTCTKSFLLRPRISPTEITNPKRSSTHLFMYKRLVVQMELHFISICSKSPQKDVNKNNLTTQRACPSPKVLTLQEPILSQTLVGPPWKAKGTQGPGKTLPISPESRGDSKVICCPGPGSD